MIGRRDNSSESWKTLPWKKFRRNLFRLQKRVYKAAQVGDKRKAKSLQKLILKSTAARLLAIRQVSQLNAGKKTAGIDGKKSLNYKERFELNELLKASVNNWKHQGLREIPIPKKDGTNRMLKIPTIADRAYQCLVKYALEPACALQLFTLGATDLGRDVQRMTHRKSCSLIYAPTPTE
jgi:retron-type reverse transcriptase